MFDAGGRSASRLAPPETHHAAGAGRVLLTECSRRRPRVHLEQTEPLKGGDSPEQTQHGMMEYELALILLVFESAS